MFFVCSKLFIVPIASVRCVCMFLLRNASAERGNATVSRPSVCLSVRPKRSGTVFKYVGILGK